METDALLHSVGPIERHHADKVFRRCPHVRLQQGETVDRDELPASKLLVVESGIVQVTRSSPRSQRLTIVALASAGAILLPPASDERIGAVTHASLVAVPAKALPLLMASPKVAEVLCNALLEAVGERQASLTHIHGATHAQRLRETLFHLARRYGTVGTDGIEIRLPLTHELLARLTGSARETVTSTLAGFEREGLISREGGALRLTMSPAQLDVLVEE